MNYYTTKDYYYTVRVCVYITLCTTYIKFYWYIVIVHMEYTQVQNIIIIKIVKYEIAEQNFAEATVWWSGLVI